MSTESQAINNSNLAPETPTSPEAKAPEHNDNPTAVQAHSQPERAASESLGSPVSSSTASEADSHEAVESTPIKSSQPALSFPARAHLNLKQKVDSALQFYSSYHQNPINKAIHSACIPVITWTTMVWLSQISMPGVRNLTNLLAIGYTLGYSAYNWRLGVTAGGTLAAMSYTSEMFARNVPGANYWALGLHLGSWVAQIVGHRKFEGNQPALTDSLGQSLYIAPLFSLIELGTHLGIIKPSAKVEESLKASPSRV